MKVKNPFFIKGYHGAKYFCDRQKETKALLGAIRNGRDVTLMAPRRYGKTGLIHNVFAQLDRDYVPIYLDIFQLKDLSAVSGKTFVDRNRLPPPSTVRSVVSDLIARDLIYRSETGCQICDRLFGIWLASIR